MTPSKFSLKVDFPTMSQGLHSERIRRQIGWEQTNALFLPVYERSKGDRL
jgi:hypothetical protein